MIALAEALGLPFATKHLEYNALRRLGPRLLGRSLASLTAASREALLSEPPPDLTLSVGHRSVAVVQALRARSGGRMRSIHVGFPRVSPGAFDLVITTPQYPVEDHPNVLRFPYALTRTTAGQFDPVDVEMLAVLPKPHRLLIVGGPTIYWELDAGNLARTLEAMLEEARVKGGSVIATTSPRTPTEVARQIASTLERAQAPTLLARPGESPSYPSLLRTADSIHITADSVAMVSDAICTGKPLALVRIRKSALGKVAFGLMDRIRPGRRIYPRDLRYFWHQLEEIGISERLGTPRASSHEQLRLVLDRTRPILQQLSATQGPK